MKIKHFGKSKISLPLPYLLSIQKANWEKFWREDLKELFQEISPIRDYAKKELELWFCDYNAKGDMSDKVSYRLEESKYKNDLEAKQNNDSYEAPLRINIKLVNLKTKEIKEQEVFLTDFPLMTERGTFIVNGVERVAISQLIRSPGAFFTIQTIGDKNYFGAKIIPNRGAWLEFETESTGFIGVKIDRKRKISATTLLRAFGIDKDEAIKEKFQGVDVGEINYIDETIKREKSHEQAEALVEIYRVLRPDELVSPDTARELITNMFFNFERYDLSKVGRWRMWQRLPELKKSEIQNGSTGSPSRAKSNGSKFRIPR